MTKEINATFTKKQNLLRQQERISEMKTLFVVLSLHVRRRSREEIWPLRGFFTVSLLHADLHLDKVLLFLKCEES